jgi:hypothetical protein
MPQKKNEILDHGDFQDHESKMGQPEERPLSQIGKIGQALFFRLHTDVSVPGRSSFARIAVDRYHVHLSGVMIVADNIEDHLVICRTQRQTKCKRLQSPVLPSMRLRALAKSPHHQ